MAAPGRAAVLSVRVHWRPSTATTVVGYRIYTRLLTGAYGLPIDVGLPTPAADGTLSSVLAGIDTLTSQVFGVSAYQAGGVESPRSNEIVLAPVLSTTTTTVRPPATTSTTLAANACTRLLTIPSGGGVVTGTTSGASTLAGTCSGPGDGPEQVYRWTPATSGVADIETCSATSTTFDTVLYLRQTSCTGPQLACNDDAPSCGTTIDTGTARHGSRLTPTVTAGQTYYIVVDGYGGSSGPFALTVVPPPACPTATLIPAAGGVFTGTTTGTGTLAGSCGGGAAPERMFQWTPSASGVATIHTCSSTQTTFDTVLYVLQGTCGGSPLACNDDTLGCGTTVDAANPSHGSKVTVAVVAGQTYDIVVDGYSTGSGAFALTVVPPGGVLAAVATAARTTAPPAAPSSAGATCATGDGGTCTTTDPCVPGRCDSGTCVTPLQTTERHDLTTDHVDVDGRGRLHATGTFDADTPVDPTSTGAILDVWALDGTLLHRTVMPPEAFLASPAGRRFRFDPRSRGATPAPGVRRFALDAGRRHTHVVAVLHDPALADAARLPGIHLSLRVGDTCVRRLGLACTPTPGGTATCE